MSDSGLTVRCMTELARRYDITFTVDRDGGQLPDLAAFVAAGSISQSSQHRDRAYGWADQPVAVAMAVALAVVSEALDVPVTTPQADDSTSL